MAEFRLQTAEFHTIHFLLSLHKCFGCRCCCCSTSSDGVTTGRLRFRAQAFSQLALVWTNVVVVVVVVDDGGAVVGAELRELLNPL